MKAIDLYRYLQNNSTEVHITHNGQQMNDMSGFVDGDYIKWSCLMFPMVYDLKELTELLSPTHFEDEGIECNLKQGYLVLDLLDIMSYYGIEPCEVFSENHKLNVS